MWCCAETRNEASETIVSQVSAVTQDECRAVETFDTSMVQEVAPAPPAAIAAPAPEPPRTDDRGDAGGDASSFAVTLRRAAASAPWGLNLEMDEINGVILVSRLADVQSSVAHEYNKSAPEKARLRTGDYIQEVSGTTTVKGMHDKLQSDLEVNLVISRPKMFTASIPKRGKPLGLTLRYVTKGLSILIGAVIEGAAKDSKVDIQQGDRILSVDGRVGVNEMLDALKNSPSPTIVFSRRA